MKKQSFSDQVIAWQKLDGRNHLPWQKNPSRYRVWVSEIMLQQTQVATVLKYYDRFILSFPDIETLANTPLDEVLNKWSGLGYYRRAINLHHTAKFVLKKLNGVQVKVDGLIFNDLDTSKASYYGYYQYGGYYNKYKSYS